MVAHSWKRWLVAGMVSIAGLSEAAPVEVRVDGTGPFAAGSTLVVRLFDTDLSSAICVAGICAADLRVKFDTALIQEPVVGDLFPGWAGPGETFSLIGATTMESGSLAFIDISLFAFPSAAIPAGWTDIEILSLSFTVQAGAGGTGAVTVEPFALRLDGGPSYEFAGAASPAFDVAAANTVPEPASFALMAMGLGLGGWTTRRRRSAAPAA
ncbi:PEP-CTERM sorting domain-containing protein [Pseudorhodoferax soli]|uniref:Putative secreted protein with PEP-CTERM sorting signal n=1 Tax=Pseudorhodoferax soli TaxID=545864 RepID=A0A368XV65_9BURK|nr:PEP-CTERM sorting domain-containing protein [Pseudorhodoferax soli]RCW71379.1 putative secreted protein with PEP-CTERM sorting signal [Pseudorhodoferax soli]